MLVRGFHDSGGLLGGELLVVSMHLVENQLHLLVKPRMDDRICIELAVCTYI